MKRIKQLKQYSGNHFSISFRIGNWGNISSKSLITYYGETRKKWNTNNKEKIKSQAKKYRKENKEKTKKYNREYYKINKNHELERSKKYKKTSNGKKACKKEQAKRKGFGFNTINNLFENCEGHHIDYENVIFIPKELHRSVWHSVTKNINMDKINKLAFEWYRENQ